MSMRKAVVAVLLLATMGLATVSAVSRAKLDARMEMDLARTVDLGDMGSGPFKAIPVAPVSSFGSYFLELRSQHTRRHTTHAHRAGRGDDDKKESSSEESSAAKKAAPKNATAPCAPDFECPIVDGVCCTGGKVCCPMTNPCVPLEDGEEDEEPYCGESEESRNLKKLRIANKAEAEKRAKDEYEYKTKLEKKVKASKENLEKQKKNQDKVEKEKGEENAQKNAAVLKKVHQEDSKKLQDNIKLKKLEHDLAIKHLNRVKEDKEKDAQHQHEEALKALKRAQEKEAKRVQEGKDKEKARERKAKEQGKKRAAEQQRKKFEVRFYNGWSSVSSRSSYRSVKLLKIDNNCILSGLMHNRYRRGGVVMRLGTECRPSAQLIFNQHGGNGHNIRIDVASSGYVYYYGSRASHSWIPLDGISFTTSGFRKARLGRYWSNYGGGYTSAGTSKTGDYCSVQGMLRAGRWYRNVVYLPGDCRPNGRLIFNSNAHVYEIRVDVIGHRLYWINRWGHYGWMSVNGIGFMTRSTSKLSLQNGWRAYGYGYRAPSFKKQGNWCVVSGLARRRRSGRWGTIGRLPRSCRPNKRLIFYGCNHSGYYVSTRIDVLPNGYLVYIQGGARHGWVSLDGIRFMPKA